MSARLRKQTLDALVLEAVGNGGFSRAEIVFRLNQDPGNAWLFGVPYTDAQYNSHAADAISFSLQRLRNAGKVARANDRWEVVS